MNPNPWQAPSRFHLSFFVPNLNLAKQFYIDVLGGEMGRVSNTKIANEPSETPQWIDINFFGHQLSLHKSSDKTCSSEQTDRAAGKVDNVAVPMPHFGAILPEALWHNTAARLQQHNVNFVIPPQTRFAGQTGEQHTLFFSDPFGHHIELKAYRNEHEIFAQ